MYFTLFHVIIKCKGKTTIVNIVTQIEPIWVFKKGLMDIYTCLFCQMQLPCLFCGHAMTVNMQLFISTPLKSPTFTHDILKLKQGRGDSRLQRFASFANVDLQTLTRNPVGYASLFIAMTNHKLIMIQASSCHEIIGNKCFIEKKTGGIFSLKTKRLYRTWLFSLIYNQAVTKKRFYELIMRHTIMLSLLKKS